MKPKDYQPYNAQPNGYGYTSSPTQPEQPNTTNPHNLNLRE